MLEIIIIIIIIVIMIIILITILLLIIIIVIIIVIIIISLCVSWKRKEGEICVKIESTAKVFFFFNEMVNSQNLPRFFATEKGHA